MTAADSSGAGFIPSVACDLNSLSIVQWPLSPATQFGADTRTELRAASLNIVDEKKLDYLWYAPDMQQLASFCRLLFGMVNADTSTVVDGIRHYLGTQETEEHAGLNWQLQCFTCTG